MIQRRSSPEKKTPLQQRRPEFCLFFWRKPGGAPQRRWLGSARARLFLREEEKRPLPARKHLLIPYARA